MRFLSNFGCKIIFMCCNNFCIQQDSNLLFKGTIGHVTSQCKWPIETKSASRYFSFFPSHDTPRAPQPNPQSSLIPKTIKQRLGTSLSQFGSPLYRRMKFWLAFFPTKLSNLICNSMLQVNSKIESGFSPKCCLFSVCITLSGCVKICQMRYRWKDLSSLILLITILISLNGKFNGSRKNKYAWVHKRTKRTVKELMKADSPINNLWVKER